MARRRLLVIALLLACRPRGSASPRPAETVELPPPAPLALEEPPLVGPTFDGGRPTEFEIPTVRCDDMSPFFGTRVFPPPTWKVKATPELLALDDPPSQLRVYISPFQIALGPPGFGCRSITFSSGPSLEIQPVDEVKSDPADHRPITGELVRFQSICWCLSGTFNATMLASRIFPVTLHEQLERVFADGWARRENFPTTPYPGELVTVDGLHARYVDPPGVNGIASTELFLEPNDDPIEGSLVALDDGVVPGLMFVLAVRLRAERDPLIAAIIADFDARMREDRDDPLFRSLPRCHEGNGEGIPEPRCRH